MYGQTHKDKNRVVTHCSHNLHIEKQHNPFPWGVMFGKQKSQYGTFKFYL